MYKRGDLRLVTPSCKDADEYGNCFVEGHIHILWDSRDSKECHIPSVCLPHSCGDWVIGSPEQIEMLITDLSFILKRMEEEESL